MAETRFRGGWAVLYLPEARVKHPRMYTSSDEFRAWMDENIGRNWWTFEGWTVHESVDCMVVEVHRDTPNFHDNLLLIKLTWGGT